MRFFGKSDRTPKLKPRRNSVITLVIGLLGTGGQAFLPVSGGQAFLPASRTGILPVAALAEAQTPSPPPSQKSDNPSGWSSEAQPLPASDHQTILEKAIIRVESCDSISAKTRQSVELFGKRLVGTGTYLEQHTPPLMFRLEMKLQLGEDAATLIQSCDGSHLWLYEDFRGKPNVGQVDIARVARVLEEKGEIPKPGMIGQWPGLGGLPKMLRGLNLAFDFAAPEEALLEDRLSVFRLQGQWKPERLARFLPDHAEGIKLGKPVDLDKLPPYLPHYVVLLLERDGLFPRRIEYWRRKPASPRQEEPSENHLIVAMDLIDVRVNVPIDRDRFKFDPGKLSVSSQTERYLEDLGVK